MRGGASWLGFLLIPLTVILVYYVIKFIARKLHKRTAMND